MVAYKIINTEEKKTSEDKYAGLSKLVIITLFTRKTYVHELVHIYFSSECW